MSTWLCEWMYQGGYDAFTSVQVHRGGLVIRQRGTYHSHPAQRLRGDWPRLQTWLTALDQLPALTLPALLSDSFVSTMTWAGGRELRWQGKYPAAPGPLRSLLEYVDGLAED